MNNLLSKLTTEEQNFLNTRFLSPVIAKQSIQVRINNIILKLYTRPNDYTGWGIFKPLNFKTARFLTKPSRLDIYKYLQLFPTVRFILCHQQGVWYGIQANPDNRFTFKGQVPIYLTEEVQQFQTIIASFDGSQCWFDSVDMSRLRVANDLRHSLSKLQKPEDLKISNLSKYELFAYNNTYMYELKRRELSKTDLMKQALERGGARYLSHIERQNTYTVEFNVDGQNHRSVVNKNTLQVQSAGICLSGGDANFDLQSLVGVIKEGEDRRLIYRV